MSDNILQYPDGSSLTVPFSTGSISDGYHTFDDLYAHRIALFLALCRATGMGWKSRLHANGSSDPGWFLAGMMLPVGGDITYHLPDSAWTTASFLVTFPRAPSGDGHTSKEVVKRLLLYAVTPETTP
jgi:hypothetical protein